MSTLITRTHVPVKDVIGFSGRLYPGIISVGKCEGATFSSVTLTQYTPAEKAWRVVGPVLGIAGFALASHYFSMLLNQ